MQGALGNGCLKGAVGSGALPARLCPGLSFPPFLLYRSGSTGQGRRSPRLAGFPTQSWAPVVFFPGRDFSPTVDKWGTKAQSCGEGKVFAHLDLGWSCVLLVTFSLSPTYFSQLFCFFFFFLLKKTCKFLEGVPHLPTRVSPISKTVPLTGHKPVRNLQLCSCYRKGA